MLKDKFGFLESVGKGLLRRLFDHPRPCETDGRAGFGKNNICLHREACRHAAGRRIGKNSDIQKSRITVPPDRGTCFCHLQERQQPFLHAGTAGDRKADDRQTVLHGIFKQGSDFFADSAAHAAHHEVRLHNKQTAPLPADQSGPADHGFFFAARRADSLDLVVIAGKIQRIFRPHIGKEFVKASPVGYHLYALARFHSKMVSAGADKIIRPETAQRNIPVTVRAFFLRLTGVTLNGSRSTPAFLQLIFGFHKIQQSHFITCFP